MKRITLALLATLVATPGLAAQQFFDWGVLCTPGSITACANFSLSLHYRAELFGGAGGTDVVVEVENLQGTRGLPDSGPVGLRTFSFSGLFADLAPPWSLITSPTVGSSPTFWVDPNLQYAGSDTRLGFVGQNNQPLWGCDISTVHPLTGMEFFQAQTCGNSVVWARSVPNQVTMTDDVAVTFGGQYWEEYDGTTASRIDFSCTSGVDCLAMTSVPEPSTWILMATGLLGIAFAARRRRRAEEVVEELAG